MPVCAVCVAIMLLCRCAWCPQQAASMMSPVLPCSSPNLGITSLCYRPQNPQPGCLLCCPTSAGCQVALHFFLLMRVAAVQVTAVTRGVSVGASAACVAHEQQIVFTYRCVSTTAEASACNVSLVFLQADALQFSRGGPCVYRFAWPWLSIVLFNSGNEPGLRRALVSCSIRMALASQEEQREQWPADAPFKPLSSVQLV